MESIEELLAGGFEDLDLGELLGELGEELDLEELGELDFDFEELGEYDFEEFEDFEDIFEEFEEYEEDDEDDEDDDDEYYESDSDDPDFEEDYRDMYPGPVRMRPFIGDGREILSEEEI